MEKTKTLVIGIAGGSASGKTTICDKLSEQLQDHRVKVFHMDDYFKPEELRPRSRALVGEREYVDDNHPDTMYLTQLYEDMVKEKESGKVQIILTEGLLTLYDDAILSLLDLKLYVDCRADERILRRLKRNIQRGLSEEEITDVYLDVVRYRHDQYVEPSKWRADMILNGANPSVVSMEMITDYIKRLL